MLCHLLAVAAVSVGIVAAQSPASPVLSSDGTNLNAELPVNADFNVVRSRRQTIMIGDLDDRITAVSATVDTMQTNANMYSGSAQFVENLLETTVTEARSTAVSVARAQDAMDSRMSTLEAALSRAITSNAEQQSTMTRRNAEQQTAMTSTIQSMATSQSVMVTSVQSSVTDLTATVATQLSRADVTLGERVSTLNTSITRSVAGQMAAAAMTMAAVNRTVIAALATKDSAVKNVWIGGCSAHQYGGWRTLCLDRNELDSSAPKFRKASNTRFVASVLGIYKMSFHGINEACGWAHSRWRVNGRVLYETYTHVASWWWKDMFTAQIANIPAGQQFWVEVHASCNRLSAHHWGSHQRIEVEFKGVRRAEDL